MIIKFVREDLIQKFKRLLEINHIDFTMGKNDRSNLFITNKVFDGLVLELFLKNDDFNRIGDSDFIITDSPYPLVSKENTLNKGLNINGLEINENDLMLILGPCSIDSLDNLDAVGNFLSKNNLHFIRGGAFKPRTSPYSFQGMKEDGLEILKKVKEKYNLISVTEILSEDDISKFDDVDIIQIGARNMQNFSLLKKVASLNKVVLLKRGFSSTIDEFLSSAEYLLLYGAKNVILCERGIRTFNKETRFTYDISSLIKLKEMTNLMVIGDPSHASGESNLAYSLGVCSSCSPINGLMLEVHPRPQEALSDGDESLNIKEARSLLRTIKKLRRVYNDGKII